MWGREWVYLYLWRSKYNKINSFASNTQTRFEITSTFVQIWGMKSWLLDLCSKCFTFWAILLAPKLPLSSSSSMAEIIRGRPWIFLEKIPLDILRFVWCLWCYRCWGLWQQRWRPVVYILFPVFLPTLSFILWSPQPTIRSPFNKSHVFLAAPALVCFWNEELNVQHQGSRPATQDQKRRWETSMYLYIYRWSHQASYWASQYSKLLCFKYPNKIRDHLPRKTYPIKLKNK